MPDDRCELLCLDLEVAEKLRVRADPAVAKRVASEAKALGDPTRLILFAALSDAEELCVCDLAWVVERAQNLVSHHLRLLREQGLVSSRRDGKMILYSTTARGRDLADVLIGEAVPA